jgi:hypothetical protein
MTMSKIAICSSAVILALAMGSSAHAQKGPPASAPGQVMKGSGPSTTGTGGGASGYAPGYQFQEKFKAIEGARGASGLGGVSGQNLAPGHTIAPGFLKKQ